MSKTLFYEIAASANGNRIPSLCKTLEITPSTPTELHLIAVSETGDLEEVNFDSAVTSKCITWDAVNAGQNKKLILGNFDSESFPLGYSIFYNLMISAHAGGIGYTGTTVVYFGISSGETVAEYQIGSLSPANGQKAAASFSGTWFRYLAAGDNYVTSQSFKNDGIAGQSLIYVDGPTLFPLANPITLYLRVSSSGLGENYEASIVGGFYQVGKSNAWINA